MFCASSAFGYSSHQFLSGFFTNSPDLVACSIIFFCIIESVSDCSLAPGVPRNIKYRPQNNPCTESPVMNMDGTINAQYQPSGSMPIPNIPPHQIYTPGPTKTSQNQMSPKWVRWMPPMVSPVLRALGLPKKDQNKKSVA